VAFNALLKGFHQPLTTVIPLTGWAVERFRAKRVWMVCLVGFLAGSVLCGLSWSMESLIMLPVVQGLGGGMPPAVDRRFAGEGAGRADRVGDRPGDGATFQIVLPAAHG
jgi:MFS family permease